MEQVLAALIGWIDTSNEIVNLNSGVRIEQLSVEDMAEDENVPDDARSAVVITYANGEAGYYFDDDATAVIDRAAKFAAIGELLTSNASDVASRIQSTIGVTA